MLEDRSWSERSAFGPQTHSGHFILLPVLMIPDGSVQDRHVQLLTHLLTWIFEQEERSHDHREPQSANELPLDDLLLFHRRFAEYLLDLQDRHFEPFRNTLLDGCERAPYFINSLLLQVAVLTEQSPRMADYWRLWQTLATRVQDIAVHNAGTTGTHDYERRHRGLIRGLMHADTPWQPVDYENQDIGLGRPFILAFVQHAGMNRDVFEGLASLIYHFPTVFLEEGIPILAHWQDSPQAPLLAGNPAFYLEHALHRYLQFDHPGPLSREMYNACLPLLTRLVDAASARAYYLREQLVHSRRVQ